jgi:hypothetical protein
MNAVEIEQAISELAEKPFDRYEFPYAFLEAFGNKETTLKRLRTGATNKSDVGGVLHSNNIHILTCAGHRIQPHHQRTARRLPRGLRHPGKPPATIEWE